LEELKRFGRHRFLSDQRISTAKFKNSVERCLGHQQVNDAILILLAEVYDALLVTFDRRLSPLASSPETVELLGADELC
jgi:predicted nucleic acid-binding protein